MLCSWGYTTHQEAAEKKNPGLLIEERHRLFKYSGVPFERRLDSCGQAPKHVALLEPTFEPKWLRIRGVILLG